MPMGRVTGFVKTVAVALALASPAGAQGLDEAISLWLADNDAEALPMLSQMAQDGDADAQMLLGQIEAVTPPGAGSDFVTALPRRERIALLRAEGGLSGTSWLRVREEEGDETAAALLASRRPDADLDVARTLVDSGELEAGSRLAWEIFDRGRWNEIFALAQDDPLLAQLDFVLWMRAYFGNPPSTATWEWLGQTPASGRSGGMMMISLVAPVLAPHLRPNEQLREYSIAQRGFPAELIESGNLPAAAEVMASQVAADENLATVAAYCEQTCPEEPGFCAMQVIAQVGGMDNIRLHDTPLERLIPQEDFAGSDRAVGQLRRWMGSIGDGGLAASYTLSQCVREDIRAASAIQ
ncbi:hypothetical protein [Roseobacter sp. HKCCA0434]|uniref:hypothetical protein n=1 Tax=Roseobacter sp. HKCCA0434 TaxID=3079297 RepID=UPI002905E78C|nr:hypothetical protein [Roseobacter sp. HKCCA0434]